MSEAFDFGDIAVETVTEDPERGGGKPRKYEVNPFENWIKEALENNTGKQVILPPKMVKDALMLIRGAAGTWGYGVRIRLYNKGIRITQAEVTDLAPQAKVQVKFWPAPKQTRQRRSTADETAEYGVYEDETAA